MNGIFLKKVDTFIQYSWVGFTKTNFIAADFSQRNSRRTAAGFSRKMPLTIGLKPNCFQFLPRRLKSTAMNKLPDLVKEISLRWGCQS